MNIFLVFIDMNNYAVDYNRYRNIMNRFKILPKKYVNRKVDVKTLKKTAIILHLYYEDLFDEEKKYIDSIPSEIDVYIITANKKLEILIKKYVQNKSNIRVIRKINRGRDYSALLITFKPFIRKYEYICFVHDKKEKSYSNKKFADNWRRLFFESTICNRKYIINIISEFEKNKKLGILSAPLPPEQISLELKGTTWFGNVDNCNIIKKQMKMEAKNTTSNDPITIGSAFWIRACSLKQLFKIKLCYDDFSPEPMNYDYTLSHSFERIVGEVSSFNGYDNYYVMNDEYASKYLEINDNYLTKALKCLRVCGVLKYDHNNGVNLDKTYKSVRKNTNNELIKFCCKYNRIIVLVDDIDECYSNLLELRRMNIIVCNILNIKDYNMLPKAHECGVIAYTKNSEIIKYLKNRKYSIFENK